MILRTTPVLNHCGCASGCYPGAEELRMVRAIARCALVEAARLGEYHASFHGFQVDGMRQSPAAGSDLSAVSFLVSHRAMFLERGVALVCAPQQ